MSKPQFTAEPSMEDILASIRRMISDDKPGPNPIPDQMGRTPFGGSSPAVPAAADASRGQGSVSPLAPAPSFSSLSDALKAATGTSDQRRNLQQEIAEVLEKGPPRGHRPELSTFAPATRNAAPARSESNHAGPAISPQALRAALDGPHALPGGGNSPAAETGSDFQSLDFGTHVPQRDASGNPPAGDPSPAFEAQQAGQQRIELPKSEGQRIVAMPSRTPGMSGSGLNGATVAPFPRPVRDGMKASHPAPAADPDDKGDRQPVAAAHDDGSLAGSSGETNTAQPARDEPRARPEASAAQTAASEALLDAVVDMVHKQPDTLSVFTSGASFINGVAAKSMSADNLAATMSGKSGAPPKMDKAAAELLRPMLRQWLSDNMPRIVEEALRSELMSTQQAEGDTSRGPGKG